MFKFLHLICGTTFLGIIIAAFFYIARSVYKGDRPLIDYSLRASYFGDALIVIILFFQLVTAVNLVLAGYFTPAISWIFIAYCAFGVIILLWLGVLFIKLLYFSKSIIPPLSLKIFYVLNGLMIIIFIIIIYDAVTQSTWFDFLFRT